MAEINETITMENWQYNEQEIKRLHIAMNARALRKRRIRKTVLITLNIVMAVFILFPLLYTVSVSLMPSDQLFTMDMNLLPKSPTLDNYARALTQVPLVRFILNSFLVAGCITLGQIVTCSLAAFAFSFLEFRGKNVLFMLVMATMMVPGEATIISNYLTVSSMGLLDTYPVLILPSLTSAMGIFLFRQFYMTFPKSLYESAKLDGCGNLKFIVKILIPLTKSAIGAMAVYTFINAWNMYMWPLLVTGSEEMRTVHRYQYVKQCGCTVYYTYDGWCCGNHHSFDGHFHCWTKAVNPWNVFRSSQGLT